MQDTVRFLLRFFHRFPRYAQRPLYVTGESYGGHYVPTLAHAILKYNASPDRHGKYARVTINLKVRRWACSVCIGASCACTGGQRRVVVRHIAAAESHALVAHCQARGWRR